jgi:hypothetical protein
MFGVCVGSGHGVDESELEALSYSIKEAHSHLSSVLSDKASRICIGLEWARLPFQDEKPSRRSGNSVMR